MYVLRSDCDENGISTRLPKLTCDKEAVLDDCRQVRLAVVAVAEVDAGRAGGEAEVALHQERHRLNLSLLLVIRQTSLREERDHDARPTT